MNLSRTIPTRFLGVRQKRLPSDGEEDIEIESLLPKAELLYMENCGHLPMLERPEDFYSILRTFLKRTGRDSTFTVVSRQNP